MTPENEIDLTRIALLRAAGCRCETPLLGYRPDVGPRCRICNTVAAEANPLDGKATPAQTGFRVVRTRYGDQLHMQYIYGNGRGAVRTSCGARVSIAIGGKGKTQLKHDPRLFCLKCFGADPASHNANLLNCEVI